MIETTLQGLVAELVELNDDNLARRVIESNDVQWCLSELYDILDADIQEVVRCKECKYSYEITEGDIEIFCKYTKAYFFKDSFCSYGERKDNNEN